MQKSNKIHGSGKTALIISNEEMNNIWEIFLEDFKILLKGVTKTIERKNEQKGTFLGMLLGTLGASLLVNMSTGKEMLRAGYGNKEGKWIVRAGYRNKMDFQCRLIL